VLESEDQSEYCDGFELRRFFQYVNHLKGNAHPRKSQVVLWMYQGVKINFAPAISKTAASSRLMTACGNRRLPK
jgi:hypothetical protein